MSQANDKPPVMRGTASSCETAIEHTSVETASIAHAFVRKPDIDDNDALLATGAGVGIVDPDRLRYQHDALCRALFQCGIDVRAVRQDSNMPGSCQIGTTALVAGDMALIGRIHPQSSRSGEEYLAASLLAGSRIMKSITAPGCLDMTDVARIDNHFVINLSPRTNHEGAAQAAYFLRSFSYDVSVVALGGEEEDLRLSHAVCDLGHDPVTGRRAILLREDLQRQFAFVGYTHISVPFHARGALMAATFNGTVILPAGYPDIAALLSRKGWPVLSVQLSEFEKLGLSVSDLVIAVAARSQAESVIDIASLRQVRA